MSLFNIVFYSVIGVLVVGLLVATPFIIKGMKDFDRAMDRIKFISENPIWKW